MSNFYTRKGDDGYTGIIGEGRIPKNDLRADAIGTIDEANAFIGIARSVSGSEESKNILLQIQRDLYNLMAEVAATAKNAEIFRRIDEQRVKWLEETTDKIANSIEIPSEFIVPGDTYGGAVFDVARTVIRRAERRVVGLWHQNEIENQYLLKYLNRLSSLLFVLELLENTVSGQERPTLAKE
ncbi:MAG: cob(I)yrinic acid a,c-diamide adenosyltransferase [Aliifodinibius sp.]|nr:cob(I)yrinic acid a,c-diamide adenosyltransferase [candidate division Zixibacteria bacterium]NIT58898.1 cob(I)yrinic acid a,c-diamide adenosyltransferase [Fodinibius sp.]NIW46583.1 cob(I)yrinic acid a,c-diamide adenosyltransferase [Gammaproteobacteria bacterium]NIR65494.1 cob(I)yrinic acid a,c-diamide adenosyltransferase [candidate division Zixibacteria bacterium]NIS47183.1 cob(I)yrinic acid a,c-diamide adenosyltransferase [candidate division Zixibacteria bacterium]